MVAIIRGADRDPGQAGLDRARERPAVLELGMVLDFVFDRCANGHKCLTVTDEFTKKGLAIDVEGRIRPLSR